MHLQYQGYLGLQGIGNLNQVLPEPLQVSALQNLVVGDAHEIVNFHDRVCSDMIYKEIDSSITKA